MKKYVFRVTGMSCSMCESHINDAIRNVCDPKNVRSDRHRNETVVIAGELDTQAVCDAVNGLGYEAEFVSEEAYEKPSLFGFLKRRG